MQSQATSQGQCALTVTFQLGTDPDIDTVAVQNRVRQTAGNLPARGGRPRLVDGSGWRVVPDVATGCQPGDFEAIIVLPERVATQTIWIDYAPKTLSSSTAQPVPKIYPRTLSWMDEPYAAVCLC